MDREAGGKFFRNAWITGVHAHYLGTPKESYTKPWDRMDDWEQQSAMAVFQQVYRLLLAGRQHNQSTLLTREQGGRLVRIAWVGQMYKHFPNPKPAYVSDWEDMLSPWEQEVDMDIFEAIQQAALQEG